MRKTFTQQSSSILAIMLIAAVSLIFNFLTAPKQAEGACAAGQQLSCYGSELSDLTVSILNHKTNDFLFVNSYDGLQLRINSDYAGAANFQINNSANNTIFKVQNDGKVGIGADPSYKLDVNGDIRIKGLSNGLYFDDSAGAGKKVMYVNSGNNSLHIKAAGGNTLGNMIFFDSADSIARVTFDTLNGRVGIGDTTPVATLTVGNGDLFQVDASGNLVKIRNVSYSWPAGQGGANTVLTNNGSGSLSWTAPASGMANPMTTVGDIIYGGVSGAATRLAGASGFLKSAGMAAPSWSALAAADIPSLSASKITSGTFADAYITSAANWNAKAPSASPAFTGSVTVSGQIIDHTTNNFLYVNSYDGLQLRINSDYAGAANFQINNSANNTIFKVQNDGKVGIGITIPSYKLDVQGGQINASGGLCIAGDCKTSWNQAIIGSYSVGDYLLIGADTERNGCEIYYDWSWHKIKEIKIAKAGTLRIKYDLHYSGGSTNTRANIRRNGVVVGTERSNGSTNYVTYTEDIAGWSVGDYVQIYTLGAGGACALVQNFRLYTDTEQITNQVILD